MKKKVLMILNYYYPDVAAGAQLMTELCEQLQNNFEITVIAAFPNYAGSIPKEYDGKFIVKERYENINVIRVKVPEVDKKNKVSRVRYIFYYFINSIFAILRSGEQDLVFAISQPPILGGVLGRIGKLVKKAKLIYNIQDFSPEVVEIVGYLNHKRILKLAKIIDKASCRNADAVLLVGRDMQETLKKRFINDKLPYNEVINNWIDESKVYPLPKNHLGIIDFKKRHNLLNKFIFMYSGNVGLYYDLENIMKVIANFKENQDIEFVFIGDGAVKNKLVDYTKGNQIKNVRFIPYQSKEDIIYSLNAADVHIVTSAKGIKGISVPSKIYGVMAVDKPVLGILEPGSEARILIEESGCGYCCDPGDYNNIESTITKIMKDTNNRVFTGKGRSFLEKELTRDKSMEKYKKLFSSILN